MQRCVNVLFVRIQSIRLDFFYYFPRKYWVISVAITRHKKKSLFLFTFIIHTIRAILSNMCVSFSFHSSSLHSRCYESQQFEHIFEYTQTHVYTLCSEKYASMLSRFGITTKKKETQNTQKRWSSYFSLDIWIQCRFNCAQYKYLILQSREYFLNLSRNQVFENSFLFCFCLVKCVVCK